MARKILGSIFTAGSIPICSLSVIMSLRLISNSVRLPYKDSRNTEMFTANATNGIIMEGQW
jgi:hypothetical protein